MNVPSSPGTGTVGPPVPFDSELAAILETVLPFVPKIDCMDAIASARLSAAKGLSMTDEALSRNGEFEIKEHAVPGQANDPNISVLVIRPKAAPSPMPVLYHMHGGGMIFGTSRDITEEMLDWAHSFGTAIVSVEYRLAPEARHPAPVEDCYAGLLWTVEHCHELGIDPQRVVLMGASAGGGLAAATALLARDRGGPELTGQLLMCPMLDDRNQSASAIQGEGRGVWDRKANEIGWTALLGDSRGDENVSPYAAPARGTDLSNLPPAFIDVGSAETFRDEAVAYATGIWRAGGTADLHVFAGGFHAYDVLAPLAAVSVATRQARSDWLRRILGD
ncbi:MAG: Alpha/beta hydrolase fold-3 domain protein [Marmoricola sp.]|nr:Alpha/beta hydrolase fold-3 domain protein [Marmoricola sp.]